MILLPSPIILQLGAVALVALVAFVVLIRPQLKRMADHRAFLASLKIGDVVITQGGLIGQIEALNASSVVRLTVGDSMSIRVDRNGIERIFVGDLEF